MNADWTPLSSLLRWFCRSIPSVDSPTVVCPRCTYSVCRDCAFQVRVASVWDDRLHSAVLISTWYSRRTRAERWSRKRREERYESTLRCFSLVSVFIRVHDCSLASKRTCKSFSFFSKSLIVLSSSSFSWFDWFKRSLYDSISPSRICWRHSALTRAISSSAVDFGRSYEWNQLFNWDSVSLELTCCWFKRNDSKSNFNISFSTFNFSISLVMPTICSSNCLPNV